MIRACLIVFFAIASSQAQTTAPATLEQMEAIYQRELSMRHIPLISQYLISLQKAAASATDKAPYLAEIARVQELLKRGGVIDLATARAPLAAGTPMPMPEVPPPPKEAKQAVIALSPALSKGSVSVEPTAKIGEMEWRVEFMAAGAYDVHLEYACPVLSAPLKLVVDLAGQQIETELPLEKVTKDAETFRVLRLGRVTLPADLRGRDLRITAGDKSSSSLILRHLFITPAKPAS
ncbi:MAG: hypothetical protein RIS79_1067 [Verrucomicrobiota bacterium]|jgi:hypothetical protein